jgi:two-component system sensor histidine kinase UhpB
MRICRYILSFFLAISTGQAGAQSGIIDSLQKIIEGNKRNVEENKAWDALAGEYMRKDMQKAKACLYASIDLSRSLNNPVLLCNAYTRMVTVQINTGRADSAQYYLQQLEKLAAGSDLFIIKDNYHFAAGLFYKIQGNYKAALPHMIEGLNAAIAADKKNSTTGTRVSLAGSCLNIGNTYTELGDYKKALQYHLDALKIFEETNNKRGESFAFQSIGGDLLHLDQFRQAIPYTQSAMAIKKEMKDNRGVASSLGQMGNIYQGLIQYDRALSYFDSALKIVQEMKLTAEEAKADFSVGKIYSLKKEPAHAETYFNSSKLLAQQIGDSSQTAASDAELVALHTNVSRQKQDEMKLMSSLRTSIETGDKSSELNNYQYLANHYESSGQFDKALDYTRIYHRINDSLQTMEIQLQIKKLEDQYYLEKKEREIDLLKKDRQLTLLSLQKQKAFQFGAILLLFLLLLIGFLVINRYRIMNKARRLIDMERMRNHIARDLHDDIGSTLTSIHILSKMALQQVNGNGETLIASSLQKIKDRSSAMMESVADIVWTINPQNDTLEEMIFRMKEFAAEILEPQQIHYTFVEEGDLSLIKLDIGQRRDLYLLYKEAVNNAAKYSRCTNLHIHLQQDQQGLHLKIADDGIGFNEQEIRNGNGLGNMRARAASLQAGIQIDTSAGRGTRIAVDVPYAHKKDPRKNEGV